MVGGANPLLPFYHSPAHLLPALTGREVQALRHAPTCPHLQRAHARTHTELSEGDGAEQEVGWVGVQVRAWKASPPTLTQGLGWLGRNIHIYTRGQG